MIEIHPFGSYLKPNFAKLFDIETIEKIYYTGKGVADIMTKWFPEQRNKIIGLPSPSPASRQSLEIKIAAYRVAFPVKK